MGSRPKSGSMPQERSWRSWPRSRQHADRTFLVYEHERVSFSGFARAASRLAQALVDRGVHKGDRVVVAMRNLPEWPVAFFGAALAGAIVTPLNAWWTGPSSSMRCGTVRRKSPSGRRAIGAVARAPAGLSGVGAQLRRAAARRDQPPAGVSVGNAGRPCSRLGQLGNSSFTGIEVGPTALQRSSTPRGPPAIPREPLARTEIQPRRSWREPTLWLNPLSAVARSTSGDSEAAWRTDFTPRAARRC